MATWQRRARLALALFLGAFGAALYFSTQRQPGRPATPVTRVDQAAVAEHASGIMVLAKGTKKEARIEYARLLTYQDGRSRLVGVKAKILGRAGRDFLIAAREADIGRDQSSVDVRGDVSLTSSDGLEVRADSATYTESEGIVRAPGPVRFSRGGLSGSGVGMTYDKNRDVLWLLDQAVIDLAAEGRGEGAATITAGAAGLARADGYARFERGVKVERGGGTLEGDSGVAYLSDDQNRVQMIELHGRSRLTGAERTPGALESMRSRDMNLAYGADGQALERATLGGAATIEFVPAGSSPGRRISADFVDLGFAPDGTTVTSIAARDRVEVVLPATGDSPDRVVEAVSLSGTGTATTGLTSVTFNDEVEYRESRPGAGVLRTARARTLTMEVKPGLGDLETAKFVGGTVFEEAGLQARAREARYDVAAGKVSLAGADEQSGAPPNVVDDRASIRAERIEIGLDNRSILAVGGVQSVTRPGPGAAASGTTGGASGQAPHSGLFRREQAINGMADSLTYDGESGDAVYTGRARLWQGATKVEADRVAIDDRRGDLDASGTVRTTLVVEQADQKTKATEKVLTTASGATLKYVEADRRATYTTEARLTGSPGDLRADTVVLFFRPTEDAIDRLEATGAVKLKTPDGREGTGEHLEYFAADEHYELRGAPVTIVEECRETRGRTLIFFRSVDRIIVDGNEETRTETKGSKCPVKPVK